jgi:hypothetical protein
MVFSGLAAAAQAAPSAELSLIETLRHAHRLLVHADHDYDGHRAKAAEEVHKALIDLGYGGKKALPALILTPTTGVVVPLQAVPSGRPKVREPQGTSDAQLHEAGELLKGALAQLNGTHPKATANIEAAIREIRIALKLK